MSNHTAKVYAAGGKWHALVDGKVIGPEPTNADLRQKVQASILARYPDPWDWFEVVVDFVPALASEVIEAGLEL